MNAQEEESPMDAQQLAYIAALKRELTAKEQLLRQTIEACSRAEANLNTDVVNYKVWDQLEQRQMYTSSRSDPIGIASLKQSLQVDNQQSIFDDTEQFLVEMVNKQKQFNGDMSSLIVMLQERLLDENISFENAGDPMGMIQEMKSKIFDLIRNHMAVDISTPVYPADMAAADMTNLIRRLINGDSTLTVHDFQPDCMNLFRILDTAYLLKKTDMNGTIYVKLEDLT
ncbi:Mcm22 [Kluyveromyces lactis]|nr:Mcm22 [Kluyveromyces lactis]